jgi:hypothetical protein
MKELLEKSCRKTGRAGRAPAGLGDDMSERCRKGSCGGEQFEGQRQITKVGRDQQHPPVGRDFPSGSARMGCRSRKRL